MQRLVLGSFLLGVFVLRSPPPAPMPVPDPAALIAGVTNTSAVTPALAALPGVHVLDANNNLDVTWHAGRFYLAFRTAPTHFASREARLYVVSSPDEKAWTLETSVAMGSDVREPRLLPVGDRLFLYFAVLGSSLWSFEPREMMAKSRAPDGSWSEARSVYRAGYLPWRTKTIDGRAYLVAYGDGRHIYQRDGVPLEVHWLTTRDGWHLEPVIPGQPAVQKGGGSEADLEILSDGSVVSVIRNEAGDAGGWGSKICRAEPQAPGNWRCRNDPRKFDSPLLFQRGDRVYLVARRHLRGDGAYDLGWRRLPAGLQTLLYQLDYWRYPKRCAVWQVDPKSLAVSWLADLPSRGDTCFAAVAPAGEDSFHVYNYSSPVDGPDLPWVVGQLGKTMIYRSSLRIPPNHTRWIYRSVVAELDQTGPIPESVDQNWPAPGPARSDAGREQAGDGQGVGEAEGDAVLVRGEGKGDGAEGDRAGGRQAGTGAVERVTRDGEAGAGQVHAELVGASGFGLEAEMEQLGRRVGIGREVVSGLDPGQDARAGVGGAAVRGLEAAAFAPYEPAPPLEGRGDLAHVIGPFGQGLVHLLHAPALERDAGDAVGLGAQRKQDQARHLEVQAVDGPQSRAERGLQLAAETGARVSGAQAARHGERAGRLVYRHHPVVGEDRRLQAVLQAFLAARSGGEVSCTDVISTTSMSFRSSSNATSPSSSSLSGPGLASVTRRSSRRRSRAKTRTSRPPMRRSCQRRSRASPRRSPSMV